MNEEEMLKELTELIKSINLSAKRMIDNVVEIKKKSLLVVGSDRNKKNS